MLNLNGAIGSLAWKVLIYDSQGQNIISPVLKIADLRSNGVTVNLSLSANRQEIPDVPAIYFIAPTVENIQKLGTDFSLSLYGEYYINFTSPLPRPILELLAATIKEQPIQPRIVQVYDQFLNFTVLDHNLFSLNIDKSYSSFNSPASNDNIIDSLTTQIANSLFSVLKTMNVIPIIRCPHGNAAEMVATKLDGKLRDFLINSRGSGLDSLSLTRPVLVMLDRNIDLTSMLVHTWSYSSMIHDLLDMKSNAVSVLVYQANLD